MRTVDSLVLAQLALGGVAAKDVKPVLVPNVIRGADDFIAGTVDALYFAIGAPKVREADASVGGIRALDADATPENLAASRKIFPYGYLSQIGPGPIFVGVTQPIKSYTLDYMLFTNAKTKMTSSTRSSTRWRKTRRTWSRSRRTCGRSTRRRSTRNST
jgi:hypothetical protein